MPGFWGEDTPRATNLPNPLVELPQELLDEHLGRVSNFIGLMDTPERVQAHLDAVQQYGAVKASLLPPEDNSNTVVSEAALMGAPVTVLGQPAGTGDRKQQLEAARLAWKAAVDNRKRVLAELDEEVRTLHAAFTAIKNG